MKRKTIIKNIEEFLDTRFELALNDETEKTNDSSTFKPNNPNYIYYQGCCDMLVQMGYCWERFYNAKTKEYVHYVEKEV